MNQMNKNESKFTFDNLKPTQIGLKKTLNEEDRFKLRLMKNLLEIEKRISNILGKEDTRYCNLGSLCPDAELSPECSGCIIACKVRKITDGMSIDPLTEYEASTIPIVYPEDFPRCKKCKAPLEATRWNTLANTALKEGNQKKIAVHERCMNCQTDNIVEISVRKPEIKITLPPWETP